MQLVQEANVKLPQEGIREDQTLTTESCYRYDMQPGLDVDEVGKLVKLQG